MSSRPFQVMVDAGSNEEPTTAYFGSLEKAMERFNEPWMEQWRPFTWIQEFREGERPITHVKDGKEVSSPHLGQQQEGDA